jgi:hypothetical protein
LQPAAAVKDKQVSPMINALTNLPVLFFLFDECFSPPNTLLREPIISLNLK